VPANKAAMPLVLIPSAPLAPTGASNETFVTAIVGEVPARFPVHCTTNVAPICVTVQFDAVICGLVWSKARNCEGVAIGEMFPHGVVTELAVAVT